MKIYECKSVTYRFAMEERYVLEQGLVQDLILKVPKVSKVDYLPATNSWVVVFEDPPENFQMVFEILWSHSEKGEQKKK